MYVYSLFQEWFEVLGVIFKKQEETIVEYICRT